METRKIAIACFIGGVLCSAVALLFAPTYWWLGLVAGIAGGYISYEFREVCKAVPVALRATGAKSVDAWCCNAVVVKKWLANPHPFFWPGVLLGGGSSIYFFFASGLAAEMWKGPVGAPIPLIASMVVIFVIALSLDLWLATAIVTGPLFVLAFIGARASERCYWKPFTTAHNDKVETQRLRQKGYVERPLTYANAYRWIAKGIGVILFFFAWTVPKHLVIGILKVIQLCVLFLWRLFKLIHSEKWVLCATDGTLGGLASYLWLAPSTTTFSGHVVLVLFGGLLGEVFGVANWEIVSKRILHIEDTVSA